MKQLLILMTTILFSVGALAQDEEYTYYNASNGLTDASIFSLFLDSQGRVWFGTGGDGVYMYENEEFTHFPHYSNGIFNGNLLEGIIEDFAEDSEGNIWIGASSVGNETGGIYQFDGEEINLIYTDNTLLSTQVASLFIDHLNNDELWVACRTFSFQEGGLQIFKEDTILTYSSTLNNCPEGMYSITDIKRKNAQEIAITSFETPYCTIDTSGNFTVPEIPVLTTYYDYAYNAVFDVGEYEIYLSNGNIGVVYYNPSTETWWNYEGSAAPSHPNVKYLFKDSYGRLWCLSEGTSDYYLDRLSSNNTWHRYYTFDNYQDPDRKNVLEDLEGNLWLNVGEEVMKISNFIEMEETNVEDSRTESLIQYYPNPVDQQLNIKITKPSSYLLFDQQGKIQKSGYLDIAHNILYLENLPNGYYQLRIQSETHSSTHKILIQH